MLISFDEIIEKKDAFKDKVSTRLAIKAGSTYLNISI